MKKILILLAIFVFAPVAWSQAPAYDLVIQNGRIVDGSGNPWYVADVGIKDGRIAAIGRLCHGSDCAAKRTLDAKGLIVAPGFIDVHTHVEGGIARIPTADNYLFDGVTSIITGNCGGSETNLEKFFGDLRGKLSINLGTLIGHNSVRRDVMGSAQREPTPEEQAKMEALVEQAMRQGAVGFSTGLIYIPGTYSKTPEVVGLARAAAKYNGVYASHMRSEGEKLFEAIDEAITIGREANMPVEISHFKVANKKLWNQSTRSIAMVEKARAEGIDVTVDQYPYTGSSTNLGTLLPSWALADGSEAVRKRLADPATRKKIAGEMKETINKRNGRKRLDYAVVASCSWDNSLEGKSITRINKEKGRKGKLADEIQTVLDMMEKGGASMIYHSMDERDVERIMRYPYSMVASDGGVREFGRGVPHPRSYGTNARVLGRYIRERNVMRLEEAIRKMTSLPAQRFRLTERGLIRPGMWADIVVFDEKTVADAATFEKPHAYAAGFSYVLVNGEVVIEGGKHTGARSGQILLGPGAK
ncbi:MAG: D-aminoacylase [Acidobacteria bacterium]|nr:D-aminoacylase [Acidobacteriota bacterium]MCL5288802.1 D-aminoacylase [Acidobacteriota bacterium]